MKQKILAIDDHLSNLELIKSIIKSNLPECEVFLALSGNDGIEIAIKEQPDLILLDILMPGLDGLEVCEILRKNSKTKSIPILLVSALGRDVDERTKGLNKGADAFLSKPFNVSELVASIKVWLRIKKAEDLLRRRNEELEIAIKKQTQEYSYHEERNLQIAEYALEYYWQVDTEGIYTFVSPTIDKILGSKREEIIEKKTLFNFPNAADNILDTKRLLKIFQNRENYSELEILYLDYKNEEIWLKINGFPIYNSNSEFIGYRGVTHDITNKVLSDLELKKRMTEIEVYQEKLKSLNSELMKAEENERKKIAEYIHDGIGQILSIASLSLSSLQRKELPDDVAKTISQSSDYINDAISKTRLLTYDLSPPILHELGLIQAIKWRLDQIESLHDINTEFLFETKKLNINSEIEILLYRTICELLSNTIKHSEADKIQVKILKQVNTLQFLIIDNGKGFDSSEFKDILEKNGFGLFRVRERLASIGAKFRIDSVIGKGTKARITIKYN